MGIIGKIKKMQDEGKTEEEITNSLSYGGVPANEVSNAMAQNRIKKVVSSPEAEEMQPSMMTEGVEDIGSQLSGEEVPSPSQNQEYAPQEQQEYATAQQDYPQEEQQSYPQEYVSPAAQYPESAYPAYQPTGLSPDTITEIAEQVIQEKLGDTEEKLKQITSFKNVVEAKIEGIDSRLERIEKIIDRLQLSVLQKVGDYMINVDDIKKELVETQKSFKSLMPELSREKRHSQKE